MFFSLKAAGGVKQAVEVGKGAEVAATFQETPCKTEGKRFLAGPFVREVAGVWSQRVHRGIKRGRGASRGLYRERGAVLNFRKVRALVWVT